MKIPYKKDGVSENSTSVNFSLKIKKRTYLLIHPWPSDLAAIIKFLKEIFLYIYDLKNFSLFHILLKKL